MQKRKQRSFVVVQVKLPSTLMAKLDAAAEADARLGGRPSRGRVVAGIVADALEQTGLLKVEPGGGGEDGPRPRPASTSGVRS